VSEEILAAHRAFQTAELQADTDRLDTLLTDDFRSIGERGYLLDKSAWIGRFTEFGYTDLETGEVDVCLYDRAAILRCVQHSRSVWRGQEMSLTNRVSQVWVGGSGTWQLAGIQFSSHDV
jgi:hypothetical protein